MIWQIGDSLPFDFAYLASKLGKTGIAVTIKAAYKNGVAIPALAGVAIPEIGNGLFRYLLNGANVDAAGDYVIIATTADATVDQRDLYAVNVVTAWVADVDAAISTRGTADPGDAMTLEADERAVLYSGVDAELSSAHGAGSWESSGGGGDYTETLAAIKAKTDRIGTGKATVNSPVTADKQVLIVKGDSYSADTTPSRRLEWVEETWNIAADSTLVVIVHGYDTFVAERLSATAVGLELTSEDTGDMNVGNQRYSLQEITAGGETISWVYEEPWVVKAQPMPIYTP